MTTATKRAAHAAMIERMARSGYDTKHAGHPGVTWSSAIKSTRDAWQALAEAVASGEIDGARQLFEAWASGRDVPPWQGMASPMGRKWSATLAAMRIAATEQEAA